MAPHKPALVPGSGDPDELVGLQAKAPVRMGATIFYAARSVGFAVRTVQGLQEEILEVQTGYSFWVDVLRKDQLQFVATTLDQLRTWLWRDTDPVDAARNWEGSVALYPNLKTAAFTGIDERLIQLEHGFSTSEDDIGSSCATTATVLLPTTGDRFGQLFSCAEARAARAVGTDEIRVAEPAVSSLFVAVPAAPQIASAHADKDCNPAAVRTFSL